MCVCIYTYECLHVCISVHINTHRQMHICIYICLCIYIHTSTHTQRKRGWGERRRRETPWDYPNYPFWLLLLLSLFHLQSEKYTNFLKFFIYYSIHLYRIPKSSGIFQTSLSRSFCYSWWYYLTHCFWNSSHLVSMPHTIWFLLFTLISSSVNHSTFFFYI